MELDMLNRVAAKKEFKFPFHLARPYYLEDDFFVLADDLITQPKFNIHRYLPLARLPFERVWMETNIPEDVVDRLDSKTLAVGKLFYRHNDTMWSYDDFYDQAGSGVLLHQLKTYVSTRGFFTPEETKIVYRNIPSPLLSTFNAINEKIQQYGLMLGLSDHYRDDFATTSFVRSVKNGMSNMTPNWLDNQFMWILIFGMINELPLFETKSQPIGNMRYRGSLRSYFVNNIVSIKIPKSRSRMKQIRAIMNSAIERIGVRRHEVAGHWRRIRHKDKSESLIWVRDHMRGDASLGYVRQTRVVETK